MQQFEPDQSLGHHFVSVIVPIRNEASSIAQTMEAIAGQDYPHEQMEIIVADGRSTDATLEVVASITARTDIPVLVVDNPDKIVPTGLNRALRQSRGDIIVRVDGHTIIAPDYVRQCVTALDRTSAANVGGRMNPIGGTPFGAAVALATTSPFGIGASRFHYSKKEEWVRTVYLGAWRREIFDEVGEFDEEQVRNQDDEFNFRIVAKGHRILLTPAISSVYINRGTVQSLWRQYFQYGYWKVRVMQKNPRHIGRFHLVPAAFVLTLACLVLSAPFSRFGLWAAAGVAAVYAAGNIIATLCSTRRPTMFPLVAAAFAVIHIGYGTGFLLGLVRFRKMWRHQPEAVGKVQSTPV